MARWFKRTSAAAFTVVRSSVCQSVPVQLGGQVTDHVIYVELVNVVDVCECAFHSIFQVLRIASAGVFDIQCAGNDPPNLVTFLRGGRGLSRGCGDKALIWSKRGVIGREEVEVGGGELWDGGRQGGHGFRVSIPEEEPFPELGAVSRVRSSGIGSSAGRGKVSGFFLFCVMPADGTPHDHATDDSVVSTGVA